MEAHFLLLARYCKALWMNVIARLGKHKIARNMTSLIVAQIVSRGLGVLYVAALARYVGTEGIGKISTATALNGLLVLLVGPGLNTLLVRDVAPDRTRAGAYVSNMLFLKAALGIPFVLLTMASARVIGYPSDTALVIYAYTLVYLIGALGETLSAVFQAFERMEYQAASQVVRDLINFSLSLIAIYQRCSLLTIVLMSVIAEFCRLLLVIALAYSRFVGPRLAISLSMSKRLLISSRSFGVLLILHTLQSQLGILVLSLFHPEHVVGTFSAANSVITMLLLLPAAFSGAIFPSFSSLYGQARHDLARLYATCFKLLLVLGFPLGLGAMLVGDRIMLLVYGGEFEASATVLRILAVFLFTIVGYSNGPLLNAAGRERFFAWTQGLAVVANAVLCLLLVPTWGAIGPAIAFVSVGIATFFVHSIASHRLLELRLPWLTISKVLLATLAMGLVARGSLWAGVPWLVVVFTIAPIAYGLASLALGTLKREDLRTLSDVPSGAWTKEGAAPA